MYPKEEERKAQEKKTKQQLDEIQSKLWVYNDSIASQIDKERAKTGDKSIKEAKTTKINTKAQTAPTHNVTRTMRNRKRN